MQTLEEKTLRRVNEQVRGHVATQKHLFLTDSSSKKAQIGHQMIELRNASPKRMQLAGRISGLAFKTLHRFR
ncbi:DUF6088 family protein [Thalassobacterium maritimum]|uniref:DUF6088 family protein n=1 Tax=Thalassobacterium maritimum TaxID=3041265 RepID=UPI003CE4C499